MAYTYRATRERRSLTARVEKRLLEAMARRLPRRITSDHLTILGTLAAFGVAGAYALSALSPHWLWLASAMLVVNWFGDSLDGTVARVRRTERPKYGYYLDHGVDAFTTAVICGGIGLSPFVPLEVALLTVVVYLIASINVYLESSVFGVFQFDYGLLGPTEARLLLIVVNAVLVWLAVGTAVTTRDVGRYATWIFLFVLALVFLALMKRFAGNLRTLAAQEPLRRGDPEQGGAPDVEPGPAESVRR